MPCKPAEYDLRKEDGERSEVEVTKLIGQRHCVRHLLLEYATRPGLSLPKPLQKELDRWVSEVPVVLPLRPGAPTSNYAYPQDGNWALTLAFRAHSEERMLCEARTLLMRLAALSPPSAEIQAAFEEQETAHRMHRLEDLEEVCGYLRNEISRLEKRDDTHSATLADVRRRLLSAQRLTVDDILTDRSQLESLWPIC